MKFILGNFLSLTLITFLSLALAQSRNASAAVTGTVWSELLNRSSNYSTFILLAELSGLDYFLQTRQNITVLAPTDDAFNSLPSSVLSLFQLGSLNFVTRSLISYHIVEGKITTQNISQYSPYSNNTNQTVLYADSYLSAIPISFYSVNQTQFYANDAQIIDPDIIATNGVIHGIDRILNPSMALTPVLQNPFVVPFDAISLISLLPNFGGTGTFIGLPFLQGSSCVCQH